MKPRATLAALRNRGAHLYLADGVLRCRAPVGAIDEGLRARVALMRDELTELVRCEVQQEALGWKVRAWRADGRIFCQGASNQALAAIHSLEGGHIFSGQDVAQGVRLDGRHIIDIHPTILRFFDIERTVPGVAMPVFRNPSLNTDSVPEPAYRNIAVVQTLPVYETLRTVNELRMRFRNTRITLIGHERFRLLYDIYHMQIMEGDVIRTIRKYKDYIAHYHTGGVPGRNEIDGTQELNYHAICQALVDFGYAGYLGQEFIPKGDPMTSLAQAARICDV